MSSTNLFGRIIVGTLLAILAIFLLTGLFDYIYFRSIIGTFEQGLGEINWINPHLGKAVLAAFSAIAVLLFVQVQVLSPARISRTVGRLIALSFGFTAILQIILTFATWGYLFDSLGHSHLYYGIDDNNEVRYFTHGGANPETGEALIPLTSDIVREIEMRRRAKFAEIKDPPIDIWFSPGSGKPKLWYAEREDGYHFFELPGFDPATSQKLEPVTSSTQQKYLTAKKVKEEQGEAQLRRESIERDARIDKLINQPLK